jgi:hypothetical protein
VRPTQDSHMLQDVARVSTFLAATRRG